MQVPSHASLRLLLGALLLGVPFACQLPRSQPEPDTLSLGGVGLDRRQPADIALAPLDDRTGLGDVPLADIRRAFQKGLVDRLYSPLDLAYVDAHWSSPSFAGAPPPDALLVVSITEWDARRLRSSGVLEAAAEMRLYEGGSPTGPMLWGVSVRRTIDLGLREGQTGLLQELLPPAIERFVGAALAELPERDPVAAHG